MVVNELSTCPDDLSLKVVQPTFPEWDIPAKPVKPSRKSRKTKSTPAPYEIKTQAIRKVETLTLSY